MGTGLEMSGLLRSEIICAVEKIRKKEKMSRTRVCFYVLLLQMDSLFIYE